MTRWKKTLLGLALAASGCIDLVAPSPALRPPPPSVVQDPCAGLTEADRTRRSIHLGDGGMGLRLARCLRPGRPPELHVIASTPDLSAVRTAGLTRLTLQLEVPDPAGVLATLAPIDPGTSVDLWCEVGRHIGAKVALEKLGQAAHVRGPSCLSFELRRADGFGETRWTIDLAPQISRDDFDALVAFARTHPTRFTLDAASTPRAAVLADLALPPEDVGVWCRDGDDAVSLAGLGALSALEELSILGPCKLEIPADGVPQGAFGELRRLLWRTDGEADIRVLALFPALRDVEISAKAVVGGPTLEKLPALERLWVPGTFDREPSGKRLAALTMLGVGRPPAPAFLADLPNLTELRLAECAPVKNANVQQMACHAAALPPGEQPALLDLRGLPRLRSLEVLGPCMPVASSSLTDLACRMEAPVAFHQAPALTTLRLKLLAGVGLSSLAGMQKLETLTVASGPERVSLAPLLGVTSLTTLRLEEGCFSGLEDLYSLPRLASVHAPRLAPLPAGATRPDLRQSGQDRCRAEVAR